MQALKLRPDTDDHLTPRGPSPDLRGEPRSIAGGRGAARPVARLQPRIDAARALAALTDAFDLMRAPAVICGADGRVLAQSRYAEAALGAWGGLRVEDGRLRAAEAEGAATLTAALEGGRRPGPRTLRLAGPGGVTRTLDLLPLDEAVLADGWALILRIDRPDASPAAWRTRFGLTRAEAEVAALLADGLDVREAAGRRGAGLETVRSQIKSMMQKTGVRRQADLLRALGGG